MKRAAILLTLLLAATSVSATTIVLPTDEQLIAKSDVVVTGSVLSSRVVVIDDRIWTESVIATERTLKGTAPSHVIVRELGGVLPERQTVIFGNAEYCAGEKVLAFLTATPRGDYQTTDMFVGKFTERMTRDGRRVWHRDADRDGTQLLDSRFRALSVPAIERAASEFEAFIDAAVQGQAGSSGYVLVDVALKPLPVANFTLIDEPNVYRWFSFERGATAAWRSYGAQAGYTNNGVTELQTAMSTWTSFPNANIRYSYAGTTNSAGGLTNPNGTNEVLFGDPLNEVAGTWDSTTGGVVGVGGFNSVSDGGAWSSPFAADALHPQRTYTSTGNILEGNLVIQDGVSPLRGISSAVLAEILAHEFGHTLGFGHSADRTALMYYQVTGGGASLKADDQVAARWLYPGSNGGGGGNPTAPAAPSNLAAEASSDGRVTLSWRDNATNEEWQRIYIAQGSGGFTLLTTVGANVVLNVATNLQRGQSYSFRVTAVNASGESTGSNIATVVVPTDQPVAGFTLSPINGVVNQTVFTFTDRSTGPITTRSWSFGDGNSSTATNPTHTYGAPGVFTVTLTVGNGTIISTATRNLVVTTADAPVSAGFSFLPATPSIIDTVMFVDESTGPVNAWAWNFGDNTTSNERNPAKRFETAGTYNVALSVTGSNGTTSTIAKVVTIATGSGGTGPVSADFQLSHTAPTTNDTVTFTDKSAGTPNSWFWDFGDGYISTQQNPAHRFEKSGTFTVTLTAGKSGSSSTTAKQITVTAPRNGRARPVRR